jgi:hypothetical protein
MMALLVFSGGSWHGLWFLGLGLTLLAVARSSVTLSEAGVVIRNPFRQRFIPWADVSDLEHGRLPQLRLSDGQTVGLEGVEPFPASFPSRTSMSVLADFEADLRSRL